jgi:hypothetical protein
VKRTRATACGSLLWLKTRSFGTSFSTWPANGWRQRCTKSPSHPSKTPDIRRLRLDDAGELFEHLAGVEDFELAVATYHAAVARWPDARIMLRQGARVGYRPTAMTQMVTIRSR